MGVMTDLMIEEQEQNHTEYNLDKNGDYIKLQERVTELEEENKKMHDHLVKQVESARKAGL